MTMIDAAPAATAPSLEVALELEARASEIRSRLDEIGSRQAAIRQELARLQSEGLGSADESVPLREERRSLDDEQGELEGALSILEDRIAREREDACRFLAEERLVEIVREHKALRGQLNEQSSEILKHAEELVRSISEANETYLTTSRMEVEARMMAARFELDLPRFPGVGLPSEGHAVRTVLGRIRDLPKPRRPRPFQVSHIASATPEERRTNVLKAIERYAERGGLGGSAAAEIIREANL